MKTLVVANQKGGVGKTTSLIHLAFDFYEKGKKVVVIDLDPQGNASYTLSKFDSNFISSDLFKKDFSNLTKLSTCTSESKLTLISSDSGLANMEKMKIAEVSENFKNAIKQLSKKGYDICLIDTAPSLGISMASALIVANYVLSPIEVEAYSIQGIKKMITTISNIRKVNPGLNFLGMIPSKVDARNPRHKRHLVELQNAYPSLILPMSIGLRSSIADAVASGLPVWKIKKTAARKAVSEFRSLTNYVFEKMDIA